LNDLPAARVDNAGSEACRLQVKCSFKMLLTLMWGRGSLNSET